MRRNDVSKRATTSKLVYTLLYDNAMLPDAAARERDKAQRTPAGAGRGN
jgi:hypothetical protein